MHSSNFGNKRFSLNACLSGDFFKQARYKQRKYEMERVKQQEFIFKIAGIHSSLERRVIERSVSFSNLF